MPSSSPEPAGAEPPPLRARIEARARDFDLPALVAVLRESFPELAVRFASHASQTTQATIVHAVAFFDDHVEVTLNLGLGSVTSPLPSYFQILLADARLGPALGDLLGIADDRLLRDRAEALAPEAGERLLPRARVLRDDTLALARPTSCITAHWVFGAIYPELGVTVRRASVRRAMVADSPGLGSLRLGHAAFGNEADVLVPGLEIVLCTEDSTTWDGRPWLDEARRRLRQRAFVALGRRPTHLRVLLVDLEAKSRLELARPSWLGFDPLTRARSPRVSLLFEGRVPETVRKLGMAKGDV